MHASDTKDLPKALSLLSSERPRNVSWFQAGALLFGDWGTSRLYVLGLAFLVAGRSSFWLIAAMSVLILVVGWAYTQICRIYADGGGVYTAGRHRAPILGVIGALLLFADYTVTASLSSLDGFHYFGLGGHDKPAQVDSPSKPAEADKAKADPDPDKVIVPEDDNSEEKSESLFHLNSPGLWGIISILLIGGLNLLGPKHSAGFALISAVGMVIITLLLILFALPQIPWRSLHWGNLNQPPGNVWHGFVYIVLALSGVEAIANLTGVMHRPVYRTAQKSIWLVALEVAIFNLLLAIAMIALPPEVGRDTHKEDMLAYMAHHYVGSIGGFFWGEWAVRIIGGLLLLSATNTAIGALTGTIYVMSRDNELPRVFQKLNSFGTPWVAAAVATAVPTAILLLVHEIKALASMYAIGVVGAVAINCCITTFHPRLRKWYRKTGMLMLGLFLIGIWMTLAVTKPHATLFVAIVMVVGLSLRQVTKIAQNRRPKQSLLKQAIHEQLTVDAMMRPKVLLATAGSAAMAEAATKYAKEHDCTLVVSFIREVALNYKVESENRMTLETDPAAQALFVDFLEYGHKAGVAIIPAYDTSQDAPEQIAELAAMYGANEVLIGSSRRGALHQFIKGSFQQKLEALLPEDMPVKVLHMPTGTKAA